MLVLKILGVAFLSGAAGYLAGVPLGMGLIKAFSTNTHDKAMEAAMTGAFVVGPLVALLAAVTGGILYANLREG